MNLFHSPKYFFQSYTRRFLLPVILLFGILLSSPAAASTLRAKLVADQPDVVAVGQKIHFTAKAAGGKQKKYRFIVSFGGKKTTLRQYSDKKTLTYRPKEPGTYRFYLTVKDKKKNKITTALTITVKTPAQIREDTQRQKILNTAKGWLGSPRGSGNHLEMLRLYNSVSNNIRRDYIVPGTFVYRHYSASSSDAWCDIFVSSVFLKAGLSSLIGVECSCQYHILLMRQNGIFVENDAYYPKPGDIIFYDWQDSGVGDCSGWSDHVGIVYSVNGSTITTIEGNYKGGVNSRTLSVGSRYIRGYGVPKY